MKGVLAPLGTQWTCRSSAAIRRRLLEGSHTTVSAYAGRQQMADWVFGSLCRLLEGRAVDIKCTVAEAPRIHIACDM